MLHFLFILVKQLSSLVVWAKSNHFNSQTLICNMKSVFSLYNLFTGPPFGTRFFTNQISFMETLDHFEEDYTPTQDEKTMAMLSHILTLVAPIVAPLVIFLIKKEESPYVRMHAAESLNFQISVAIYAMVSVPLILIVIGVFLLMAIGILAFVLAIVATIKANEGKFFKYPLTIRLVN